MTDETKHELGCLYGIGLGPGDQELVTLKAAKLLARLEHIFAPKAEDGAASIARSIATAHARPGAQFHELVYPMTRNAEVLWRHWRQAALSVLSVLERGRDVGFVTLGDPMLYSTCTYLMRAIRDVQPSVSIEIVPGVTSFCASAALSEFVLGEQGSKLLIAPAPQSEQGLAELTRQGGRLVLMKIGARLPEIAGWLSRLGLLQRATLVTRAGLLGQRVQTNLDRASDCAATGYLSTLLVDLDSRSTP